VSIEYISTALKAEFLINHKFYRKVSLPFKEIFSFNKIDMKLSQISNICLKY